MTVTYKQVKTIQEFIDAIRLRVDGTKRGSLVLSGFKQQYAFSLGSSGIDILYNGRSLLGVETEIKLTKDTKQELVIRCR